MEEHLYPNWSELEKIADETYITTISGYHIVVARTESVWKLSCDFCGIHDQVMNERMSTLDQVKLNAVRKVSRHMATRSQSAALFLDRVLEVELELEG